MRQQVPQARRVVLISQAGRLSSGQTFVVVQGYGVVKDKKWRIGRLLRRSKHTFDIELKDEVTGELYVWRFSAHSGRRTVDVGCEDGWIVSLKELASADISEPPVTAKRGSGLVKVHEEVVKVSEHETTTYQMWMYKDKKGEKVFYMKAFRTVVVSEDRNRYGNLVGTVKVREHSAIIPINKVQEILYQFKETAHV